MGISFSDHSGIMLQFFNHAGFLCTHVKKEIIATAFFFFGHTQTKYPCKSYFSVGDFNCWATLEVVLQITESWMSSFRKYQIFSSQLKKEHAVKPRDQDILIHTVELSYKSFRFKVRTAEMTRSNGCTKNSTSCN